MKNLIENHPDVVKSYKVVYECRFNKFMDGIDTPEFKSGFRDDDLCKKKYFFTRLIPRDACLSGKKELFHLAWMEVKKEHQNETFHYWDLNSAYTYALGKFE